MSGEETEISTLFRPVGPQELIPASGFRRFPPRLPEQPILYPVLTQTYAEQIARDWNSRSEGTGFVGCVTRFAVGTAFLSRYALRQVGTAEHLEYWVPAEELEEFNRHIVGQIEVVAEFRDGGLVAS
jgi:hypothetical protein